MSTLARAIHTTFVPILVCAVGWTIKECQAFVVRPSQPSVFDGLGSLRTSRAALTLPLRMEMENDRAGFIREGALGIAGVTGLLGISSPASAAGFLSKDVIELENVPLRTLIGKTRSISLREAAPAITAMRTEAREHFARIEGAEGGREVTLFTNNTLDGADITVGLEVSDAKGSPAISDGFTPTVFSPDGLYLKDDHNGKPGTVPWISFMTQLAKDGYTFKQPVSLFEVYSGQGGKETVTMYAAVESPAS